MQEVFGCLGQPIYGYLRDIPDLLIGMKTIRLLPIVTKFMAGQPTPTGKKKTPTNGGGGFYGDALPYPYHPCMVYLPTFGCF